MTAKIIEGDCLAVLPTLADASVDAVICDPPYPEISRPYGRMTEAAWTAMMHRVVPEVRRVLKPRGSAVFVLQPNSRKVGSMRAWLWDFMAWCCREWNMVQDVWWWNFVVAPTTHCHRRYGLMRPSIKACVWLGPEDCYRDQDQVLWTQSKRNAEVDRADRALKCSPSGTHYRRGRCVAVADERGGSTPFNLIPICNANSTSSAGAHGHGAGTPEPLCDWWVRYLVPPDGMVLDPFCGSGTVGLAAVNRGHAFIGIEQSPEYCAIARARLDKAAADRPLLAPA